MNDDLKVVSMQVYDNQLFGLTEEGGVAVFNKDMGHWVHRASSQIKSQADGNDFMKKSIQPQAQQFIGRHSFDPGEIKILKPIEVSWIIRNYWNVISGVIGLVLGVGFGILALKI